MRFSMPGDSPVGTCAATVCTSRFSSVSWIRDGWAAIRTFVTAVLSDAGYVGFQPALAMLTVDQLASADRPSSPHTEKSEPSAPNSAATGG
jgi:hypothetical protein